jgi:hypothetical protein
LVNDNNQERFYQSFAILEEWNILLWCLYLVFLHDGSFYDS